MCLWDDPRAVHKPRCGVQCRAGWLTICLTRGGRKIGRRAGRRSKTRSNCKSGNDKIQMHLTESVSTPVQTVTKSESFRCDGTYQVNQRATVLINVLYAVLILICQYPAS
ncbi:hypothetical protein M501DRAFT_624747 [Patellaria atrata CBS 101060]|uniref:Uncharacterized protein n=1 Tax=Patellaria atrata CBS 101060 TaxID=1346257 RepID=A0A9P4SDG0_9PEZI|nr:hypothetical protein M501DRAFT_624747 [Patellaria atrata CBS 101060]